MPELAFVQFSEDSQWNAVEIGGYIAIIEWDKPINGVSSPEVDNFVYLLLRSIRLN